MTPEQKKNIQQAALYLGGGALIIGIAVYLVRRKTDKKEEKGEAFIQELEQAIEPEKIKKALLSEAFSPDYWKSVSNQKALIPQKGAFELAKKIDDAWGGWFWDDDEDQVYGAFEDHRLKSYADVSKVTDQYRSEEIGGGDLWEDLNDKLSDSELARVKKIVIDKK